MPYAAPITDEGWADVRKSLLSMAYNRAWGQTVEEREDVVQDVLCNYFERCRVKEITNPYLYLYASTMNRLKSVQRKAWRTVPLVDRHTASDDIDERLDDAMDLERIMRAGGEPLIEYYQWWSPKKTPSERVWATRLRQQIRRRCHAEERQAARKA